MRFSSVFHLRTVPQHSAAAARAAPPAEEAERGQPPLPAQIAPAAPGQDLPDDLDARVRLIGEWQLGDGY